MSNRFLWMAILVGCAPDGESSPLPPAEVVHAEAGWTDIVHERILNEAHAFRAHGDGWSAEVPERGLDASFSAAEVTFFEFGQPILTLRRAGHGRGEIATDELVRPLLGDCDGDRLDPRGECVRRLEFPHHDGVTEWWSAGTGGYEQGFVVETRPGGIGDLAFDMAVDGGTAAVARDRVYLNEGAVVVTGLAAWDSDGEPLPAWFEPTDEGFRIAVDDDQARYPIEIDPLYTTSSWSITGVVGNDPLGGLVAAGGDVNGDGYADILVANTSSSLNVYVYHGSASGLGTTASARIQPSTLGAMAGNGDVNGDGYSDVLFCSTGVSIYHGSATGLSTSASSYVGGSGYTSFGASCDMAGDVNDDGYDDIIVGAPSYSSSPYGNRGAFLVFHGSASGVATTAARILTGGATDDYLGKDVSRAGDVDGDGYDDVVVGAYGYGTYGGVYVHRGSSTGIASAWTTLITATSSESGLGYHVGHAGDVDGDGYDEIMAHSYYTHVTLVYRGTSSGTTPTGVSTISGDIYAFDRAGDLDGDGYDEVVLGFGYSAGSVKVYSGSIAGLYTSPTTSITGSTGSKLGYSVVGAGDVNGDGYADLLAGAPGYSSDLGQAVLYYGSASGISTASTATIQGATDDKLGIDVATAGDVDGDGYDDVLVGAPGYSNNTGRAYLYRGSSSGLASSASTTVTGSSASASFGGSLDTAGDVNKDGYDDVVIAATGTGQGFVFNGSASGLATTSSTTLAGAKVVSRAGDVNNDGYPDVVAASGSTISVYHGAASGLSSSAKTTFPTSDAVSTLAPAGDVNGDGYDDIAAGGSTYSSSTGRVSVYTGSATTVSSTVSATLSGFNVGDRFGEAITAADLNGDAYDDLVVGATGYDGDTGRIYTYHGASTGLSTVVKAVVTGSAKTDKYGAGVASLSDLDGDGFRDVAVIASTGQNLFLYTGSATGISTVARQTASVGAEALARAGDVDNDGYDDLILGYASYDGGGGKALAYYSYADGDGDGYPSGTDCDDTNPLVTGPYTAYADADGDGYGDASNTTSICASVSGYVIDDTDCDDASASVHPGGTEVCDAANEDEDCDANADDADTSATGKSTMYIDADGDGYGSASSSVAACDASAGVVTNNTDCNDASSTIHPGGVEVCDASDVDEDCDGSADDDDAGVTGTTTAYVDADGDSYGGAAASFCDIPTTGYVTRGGDCDDSSASISPAGSEVCDAADADEDCDGKAEDADSSVTGKTTFYVDGDRDGYGGSTTTSRCDAATGYAATSTDCDDGSATVSPGATETCDASNRDEDCDGLADDADPSVTGATIFYADVDGDGFGGSVTGSFCDPASGYVASSTDCNDSDAAVNPSASEVCDATNRDEDCDGLADDADSGASGTTTFYVDGDDDGFGSSAAAQRCDSGSGYAAAATDCDDGDASSHPGAVEATGDGIDQDCDGAETCFVDADEDGLRGIGTVASSDVDCSDSGELGLSASPDCDDSDASVGAGAAEIVGDGIDQDCNGQELCYVDEDDDGYVDSDIIASSADQDCDDAGEADASAPQGDCDDDDPAYNPAAEEGNCVDPNDYNCDGSTGYADNDGDGYAACEECDDARTAVHPGATEVCNDRDDDCDGEVDLGAADAQTWYADGDGDGYVDLDASLQSCDPPEGHSAATDDDCEDSDPARHPAAEEIAGDGIDQDCSGADLDDTAAADTDAGAPDPKCGCSSSGAHPAGWMIAALLFWRRRRR